MKRQELRRMWAEADRKNRDRLRQWMYEVAIALELGADEVPELPEEVGEK